MKLGALTGICVMFLGLYGCAGHTADEPNGGSDDALRRANGNAKELTCEAGQSKLATVEIKDGKYALLSMKKSGDFFAVSGINGELTQTSSQTKWTGGSNTLKLGSDLKGTWERDGHSTNVTCKASSADDAASFRAANALTDYASEIDGIADQVLENSDNPDHKPYMIYMVANSDRDSLSLGTKVNDSQGAIPGSDDADERLDQDDLENGAMSAAYSLGGGDDYGEWFQGVSDGVSLVGDLSPALKNGTRAGFIARSKVTALGSVVDSAKPSAVEITVGPWTYYLPDAFPK